MKPPVHPCEKCKFAQKKDVRYGKSDRYPNGKKFAWFYCSRDRDGGGKNCDAYVQFYQATLDFLRGQTRIRQALERQQKPKKEFWRYLSPAEAACKMALADSDKIKKSGGMTPC